jgi:pimeloyl-ACP methyl ester carboxylesterase
LVILLVVVTICGCGSGKVPDADMGVARAAGRLITCPLLVLWGSKDDLAELYDHDILGVCRPWAPDLSGHPVSTGHHMMEEAPRELSAALAGFLSQGAMNSR